MMHVPNAIYSLPKWTGTACRQYPWMNCVRLKCDGTVAFAESTDGRRLARISWSFTGPESEYFLPAKPLSKTLRAAGMTKDGYHASLNGKVTIYGKNSGLETAVCTEPGRWPKTEDVLYPPESSRMDTVDAYWLRNVARAKLAEGGSPPSMTMQVGPVSVLLDAKYVRDMAETAIQCGFDELQVYATDQHSGVHFQAMNDVRFDSVIMPLAQD
jgi:hypothetical protein